MKDEYVISCNGDCRLPECPQIQNMFQRRREWECCCGKRYVADFVEVRRKTLLGSGYLIEIGMEMGWVLSDLDCRGKK